MAKRRTAVIVGHRGQDGTLLAANLLAKGYSVIGIGRTETMCDGTPSDQIIDVTDQDAVKQFLASVGVCEIYYLAAYHSSSEKVGILDSPAELFRRSQAVHVTGLLNVLEAMREVAPESRLFYAASSLVFSGKHGEVQDEDTPLDPVGIYGITKAQGFWLCREFRERHQIFAASGILYNHESSFRPITFLTSKIVRAAIDIAGGGAEKVQVGSLSAKVDWGLASDYVAAFQAILALESPDDFVIATGEAHSVEEFVSAVFQYFSLDWCQHVIVKPALLFREQPVKRGNANKLMKRTGLDLKRPFAEFVSILIEDHLQAKATRASNCQ